MKKTIGIFLTFLTCLLLIGINYAGSDSDATLTMKSFSINAPHGWTVERKGDDKVVFRTTGPRSGEVSIVVAADPVSGPELRDRSWRKIKSQAAYRNGVTYEGEDRFSDETWRKIVYGDEVRGRRMRCAAFFAQRGETQCLIRFSCPESQYDTLLPYFNTVKESFSFAPQTKT